MAKDGRSLLTHFTKSQQQTTILKVLPITKMKGNDSIHYNFIKGKARDGRNGVCQQKWE